MAYFFDKQAYRPPKSANSVVLRYHWDQPHTHLFQSDFYDHFDAIFTLKNGLFWLWGGVFWFVHAAACSRCGSHSGLFWPPFYVGHTYEPLNFRQCWCCGLNVYIPKLCHTAIYIFDSLSSAWFTWGWQLSTESQKVWDTVKWTWSAVYYITLVWGGMTFTWNAVQQSADQSVIQLLWCKN